MISAWIVEYVVTYFLYFILLIVNLYIVKLFIETPLKMKFSRIKNSNRLRHFKKVEIESNLEDYPQFIKHVYMLLEATTKSKEKKQFQLISFFLIIILLFFSTFSIIFFSVQKDFVLAIFLGFFASGIPYLLLQVRIKGIRTVVGNELLSIVQALTQNYNANNYDIYRGLTVTANGTKDKTLQSVLYRLVSEMQVSRTEDEMRRAIAIFIFTCGNSWSKRLGNIILKAYLYDERVMNSLINLSKQMEDTEQMLEEEKSAALEPVINGFFTPVIFIASLFLGYYVSGPQDWFILQFAQQYTILTFILSLVFTIISVFVALLLKNPKNDI